MRFSGKVALITGAGAGAGIGRATARIRGGSVTLAEQIRPHRERRGPERQAAELARIPLSRVAVPEDQTRVICFLASGDWTFVTGVTIDVTGGE